MLLLTAAEAAAGVGTGLEVSTAAGVGTGLGVGTAAGVRLAACGRAFVCRDGLPPGPPGLMSLPRVIGLGGTGFPFGVGRETDDGGSPG
jgi:hypothetical protein